MRRCGSGSDVSSSLRGAARVRTWLACGLATAVGLCAGEALAHGSLERPISRVYRCYQEGPEKPTSAACRAAVGAGGTQALYDWNGVNRGGADGRHREIVRDGELCSASNPAFRGLDLPRADWVATPIAPDPGGGFEFVYLATAPHATRAFEFYVTHDGYDPTRPLTWSDLEATPFCSVSPVVPKNGRYHLPCPLPAKAGRHVIYSIWQRSDSPEAFYACADVAFVDGSPVGRTGLDPVHAPEDRALGSGGTGGGAPDGTAWSADAVYVAGDVVRSHGLTYRARWWTRGEQPGDTEVWELLTVLATPLPWKATLGYRGGEEASHDGRVWRARWWTRGELPGRAQVWEPR